MKIIDANDIPTKENIESKEYSLPFLIIRSF